MTTELFRHHRIDCAVSVPSVSPSLDHPGVTSGDTAAVFESWGSAATSLAVWHREPPTDVRSQLDELKFDRISGWRRSLDAAMAQAMISEAMAESGDYKQALERFLAADMVLLIRIFATSTGTSRVEARLEIVREDACRCFHVDSYPARLAVTYVGPGTVWVPSGHGKKALIEQDDYAGPAIEIPTHILGGPIRG